jgi:hypothetical protein
MKKMTDNKNKVVAKLVGALMIGTLIFSGAFLVTAFAQSGETATESEIKEVKESVIKDIDTKGSKMKETKTKENELQKKAEEEHLEPLTPNGNMNIVDDYGSAKPAGKQFITVTTKSGNYFYLIIDRDDKGTETVHFLNLVDEADLLSLMKDEEVKLYMNSKGMTDVNKQDEVTEKPEDLETEIDKKGIKDADKMTDESDDSEALEPAPEEKSKNITGIMAIIFILTLGGIGGFIYFKFNKGKKKNALPDPDADYPYEDDEEDYLADMDIEEDGTEENEGNTDDDINDEPEYQDDPKGE